jgi:hypothetical protein
MKFKVEVVCFLGENHKRKLIKQNGVLDEGLGEKT